MMVLRDGSLKVADFGIARLTSAAPVSYTHLDVYKRQTPQRSWTA